MSEDDEPEFLSYRLVLGVAGPNYRDTIILEDVDRLNLTPIFADRAGYLWERYPGSEDEEYIEVRADMVITRELSITRKIPTKTTDTAPGFDTSRP